MRTSSSTSHDSRTLATITAALADDGVDEPAAGADDGLGTDPRLAAQQDVGLEDDVLAELDVGIDEGRRRVLHGHAGQQVALEDAPAQVGLEGRQLDAIVDAGQLHLVVDLDRHHPAPVGVEPGPTSSVR